MTEIEKIANRLSSNATVENLHVDRWRVTLPDLGIKLFLFLKQEKLIIQGCYPTYQHSDVSWRFVGKYREFEKLPSISLNAKRHAISIAKDISKRLVGDVVKLTELVDKEIVFQEAVLHKRKEIWKKLNSFGKVIDYKDEFLNGYLRLKDRNFDFLLDYTGDEIDLKLDCLPVDLVFKILQIIKESY